MTVDLTSTALGWNLQSNLSCGFPASQQNYYLADTDLELTLSALVPTRATLRIYSRCQDDGGGSVQVNVPGYGSVVFSSLSSNGERHVDHFLLDLTSTGLPITIAQAAGGWPAGQSHVSFDVEEWSPLATPEAAGCGGLLWHGTAPFPYYQTDHFLDLVDNGSATSSGTIRADALGQWSTFVVSLSPTLIPLQLPAPFPSTCPVLANVALLTDGVVTNTLGVPAAWQVTLPLLPPGLTLYAQHVCAKAPIQNFPGPIQWNASNVVRIDI